MTQKDIELIKSWFVLAEILITFAGLIFIASGFFVSSIGVGINYGERMINFCDQAFPGNFSSLILENTKSFDQCAENVFQPIQSIFDVIRNLFLISAFFGINSLVSWLIGHIKLRNKNFKGWKVLILVILINIIYFIFLKYYRIV